MTEREQRLREIEARVKRLKPAKWFFTHDPDKMCHVVCEDVEGGIGGEVGTWMWERDATFAAHARQDVPWLLAEVRRLEAENTKISKLCNSLGNVVDKQQAAEIWAFDLENRIKALEAEVQRLQGIGSRSMAMWMTRRSLKRENFEKEFWDVLREMKREEASCPEST